MSLTNLVPSDAAQPLGSTTIFIINDDFRKFHKIALCMISHVPEARSLRLANYGVLLVSKIVRMRFYFARSIDFTFISVYVDEVGQLQHEVGPRL